MQLFFWGILSQQPALHFLFASGEEHYADIVNLFDSIGTFHRATLQSTYKHIIAGITHGLIMQLAYR